VRKAIIYCDRKSIKYRGHAQWGALIIFIPLAITSNNTMVRVLKSNWKTLQRLVYVAAVLTLVHWVFVHNNTGPALVHFVPLALAEAYRIYHWFSTRRLKAINAQ